MNYAHVIILVVSFWHFVALLSPRTLSLRSRWFPFLLPLDFLLLGHFVLSSAPPDSAKSKGARTRRTPVRGTAKRPLEEYAKPRPMGACWRLASEFENSRFSDEAVAEATLNMFQLFFYIDSV